MRGHWHGLVMLLAALLPSAPLVAQSSPATCIAPAQPEGGFDLTCRLLAEALEPDLPITRTYLPGGVGAVAFNAMTDARAAEDMTLVAFSSGSIYNLALGRYGDHDLTDVRWLAQIARDYGAIVVREDAPWPDLTALMDAVRLSPERVAFGGGGTISGQDWMRGAMTAELSGIDHRKMRFVAFEGAGSCTQALVAGFVQACMNDVGDARRAMDGGKPLRFLAVFAPQRLPGALAGVPTAREQGIPLDWPVMRGLYMGPDVSDAAFRLWQDRLRRTMATPAYAELLRIHHLQPAPLLGAELNAAIDTLAATARARSERLGVP